MEKANFWLHGMMEVVYSPGSVFSMLSDFVKSFFISPDVRHL